ncbi:MAG: branched-chain amino acid transaminase [Actinobacteria bacterium]|nr:MAG: branched-chain amino acid transaminase [Actinomycetota bacterium]
MTIPKVDKIWQNGKLVNWDEAQVHVLTHGLHYGSGVFEGIRAYETTKGPAVFRLTDHIERLARSAKVYRMDLPYNTDELVKATKEVIKANNINSCYIRPIAFRGYGEMGLNPMAANVDVVIAVWPWGAYLGEEGIKHGVRAKISSYRRNDANTIPPAAKACGQYLNSILAKIEVISAGYDEAILLNVHGDVADGSGENIFVIRNDVIYTPPTCSGALEGITRASIMKIAEDLGYHVKVGKMVRSDLYLADEAFFTGTAAEVVPIREVDDRVIGEPGKVTKKIQEVFFKAVKGEEEKYLDWLEHV